MYKELKFELEAKEAILLGVNTLANAVKSTLGPQGNCVVIGEYDNGKPHVTKDGVTVAKNINFKDKYMDVGANLIREAALKMVGIVGDGTTTTTVLAQDFCMAAYDLMKSGHTAGELLPGIERAEKEVIESIKNSARPIKEGDIENIATISANNDSEIGKIVAEGYKKVTPNGILMAQESRNNTTTIEVISGMQFERGYTAPHFITDEVKNTCILENPLVFVCEQKIPYFRDIAPLLTQVVDASKPILLIAEDYDSEVLENLKMNKLQNVLKVCAVKAPSFGQYRKELLDDIAILTGAKNITYDCGLNLSDITIDFCGTCEKVVITKDTTTIIGGKTSPEAISYRVSQIKEHLKTVESDFEKEFCEGRIARLIGGIGTIYVGGTTELEMKERKDRIDDAICATKAAIEEGVVPGGGISFMKKYVCLSEDLGEDIIYGGLVSVLSEILKVSDKEYFDIIDSLDVENDIGYDAKNHKVVNMFDAGIINPAKSDRLAFENAVSVLKLFIKTNCVIVNEQQPNFIM